MKNRIVRFGLLFAAIALPTVAKADLTLAVSKSPLSLPMLVAQDQNLFQKSGLKVNIVECHGGVECLKMTLDGKADVATCAEIPVVLNAFDRTDYSLIATIVNNKNDMRIIANRAHHVSKPIDLVGKRLGVIARGTSQYFADLFLLFHQIDPASVKRVELPGDELLPALQRGDVDAVSVWEPMGEVALRANPRDYIRLDAPPIYAQTFNLVVMDSLKATHQADLQKLLKATKQAIDFISQHPQYAKHLMGQKLGLPADVVDSVWRGFHYELSLRPSLLATMRGQVNWAINSGYGRGPNHSPNLLDVIDPGPLQRFDPTLEGLQKP